MYTPGLLVGLTYLFAAVNALNKTIGEHDTSYKHFDCGVNLTHGTDHFHQTLRAMHAGIHKSSAGTHKAAAYIRDTSTITVPTVIHVITKQASAGVISPDMVKNQVAELNSAYAPYGVQFTLINSTFTANDAWAVGDGSDGDDMKAALRQGTYSTLNLYFQTDLYGSILGTCSLPSDIGPGTPDPSSYVSDGCNVQAGTMPNGTIIGYNMGRTAVHETGHWLGLLHTFEGYTCSGDGDFIADTPMQSTSTDGCPSKPAKDSCPSATGVDAIHNYMDYSSDACYTGFSPLQQARIQNMWSTYRQNR